MQYITHISQLQRYEEKIKNASELKKKDLAMGVSHSKVLIIRHLPVVRRPFGACCLVFIIQNLCGSKNLKIC